MVQPLAPVLVIKKQSRWVGLVRPAKSLLDVCRAFCGQSDAGLVVPHGILHSAVFIECLIHYVPGEYLPSVVLHHPGNVLPQQVRQLNGREVALHNPAGIVVIPN